MSMNETTNEISDADDQVDLSVIFIVRASKCDSLSGLSQLEYHIGYKKDDPESIVIRIWNNSGGGKFNTMWVKIDDIWEILSEENSGNVWKASKLNSLLPGKSTNTPGFIVAACLAERLICRSEKEPRQYELTDWTNWREAMQALVQAGTRIEVDEPVVMPVQHKDGDVKAKQSAKKSKVTPTKAVPVE